MSIGSTSFRVSRRATIGTSLCSSQSDAALVAGEALNLAGGRCSLDQRDLGAAAVARAQTLFIEALFVFHTLDQLLEILLFGEQSFGDRHSHERAVLDHCQIDASAQHFWRCGAP